jgi:hypothetical protein
LHASGVLLGTISRAIESGEARNRLVPRQYIRLGDALDAAAVPPISSRCPLEDPLVTTSRAPWGRAGSAPGRHSSRAVMTFALSLIAGVCLSFACSRTPEPASPAGSPPRPPRGSRPDRDLDLVDGFLERLEERMQAEETHGPELDRERPAFEATLARLLSAGDPRAAGRLVFYAVVQTGGFVRADSALGAAAECLLGDDFPAVTRRKGEQIFFAGDLLVWWEQNCRRFDRYDRLEAWKRRDFTRSFVVPFYSWLRDNEVVRKQVYALTLEDLRVHPVWEFALDEEGREGQNEATVRPVPSAAPVDPTTGTYVVLAEFLLADGSLMSGYVTPPLNRAAGIRAVHPTIVTARGQVTFWLGLTYPDAKLRTESYGILGKSAAEVFPLTYRSAVEIAGGPVTGVIDGFVHFEPLRGATGSRRRAIRSVR